jgi:hypothetical protein
MPFWLRYPIRLMQFFGRSIDDSGNMLTRPLLDDNFVGGFKIISYLHSSTGVESSPASLQTEEAKQFMWDHTNALIKDILEK